MHWPTWAGDYGLDAKTSLAEPAWDAVPDEPIVSGGRLNVTNILTATNRFYQLHKQGL